MKIIKEQFDEFARDQGYESGAELFSDLGFDREKYERYSKEVPIGGKVLETLCREVGAAETMGFIRFAPGDRERYRTILEEF